MKTIRDNNGHLYVDEDLRKYISDIWLNYDLEANDNSNIYFAKNTTVNRLITDYSAKEIKRVIKKEKADYCVINRFHVTDYPQYIDLSTSMITSDDTQEVVYGVYNLSYENLQTIELIEWFLTNKPDLKYINQNKLNDSINNGFVIDEDSISIISELVNSNHVDNHIIAANMLTQSKLETNWEYILYIYHQDLDKLKLHDKKHVVLNYINSLGLAYSVNELFDNLDKACSVVTNINVHKRFEHKIKEKFQQGIENYLKTLGSSNVELLDFKIKLKC